MIPLRQFVRKRPVVLTSLAGLSAVCGTACVVEATAAPAMNTSDTDTDTTSTTTHKEKGGGNDDGFPRAYNRDFLHAYWSHRPVTASVRLGQIAWELLPLAVRYVFDFHLPTVALPPVVVEPVDHEQQEQEQFQENQLRHVHARKLKDALTRLGPAFVKAGQQLSIRPDLVSPIVLKELQTLCDAVEPIDDDVALQLLREELSHIPNLETEVFGNIRRVASASLGQVYQATLLVDSNQEESTSTATKTTKSPKLVAIKVQRPDMRRTFSLDLFLLQCFGVIMDTCTSLITHQPPFHAALYEHFAAASYQELDYEHEAENQMRFQRELASRRQLPVIVPSVYTEYTTQKVLTSEWIEGVKLADCPSEQIRTLIPVGVELFLTQLLDIGAFHADPHPGNLLVNEAGQLCLLDFGLCAEVDEKSRSAMRSAMVHLLLQDFDSLIKRDAIDLGFLPENYDTRDLQPILTKILTVGLVNSGSSNLLHRRRKLMEISDELNEVFFQYPFSVPPFFALVTRGLGLLEGIALTGDPDFDIFQASASSFSRKRAFSTFYRHHRRHNSWMSLIKS